MAKRRRRGEVLNMSDELNEIKDEIHSIKANILNWQDSFNKWADTILKINDLSDDFTTYKNTADIGFMNWKKVYDGRIEKFEAALSQQKETVSKLLGILRDNIDDIESAKDFSGLITFLNHKYPIGEKVGAGELDCSKCMDYKAPKCPKCGETLTVDLITLNKGVWYCVSNKCDIPKWEVGMPCPWKEKSESPAPIINPNDLKNAVQEIRAYNEKQKEKDAKYRKDNDDALSGAFKSFKCVWCDKDSGNCNNPELAHTTPVCSAKCEKYKEILVPSEPSYVEDYEFFTRQLTEQGLKEFKRIYIKRTEVAQSLRQIVIEHGGDPDNLEQMDGYQSIRLYIKKIEGKELSGK